MMMILDFRCQSKTSKCNRERERERECQGNWVEIHRRKGFADLWQFRIYPYVEIGILVRCSCVLMKK